MTALVITAVAVLVIVVLVIAALDERRTTEREAAKALAELRAFRMHSTLRVRRAADELKENRRLVDGLEE